MPMRVCQPVARRIAGISSQTATATKQIVPNVMVIWLHRVGLSSGGKSQR